MVSTIVGYAGGIEDGPTYKQILDHTEAILVEFDPSVISYEQLLEEWSKMIGDKLGPSPRQYRFATWYLNDSQKKIAESVVNNLLREEIEVDPSWVAVEPVTKFYQAEEYHDHFLTSNASRMKCFL